MSFIFLSLTPISRGAAGLKGSASGIVVVVVMMREMVCGRWGRLNAGKAGGGVLGVSGVGEGVKLRRGGRAWKAICSMGGSIGLVVVVVGDKLGRSVGRLPEESTVGSRSPRSRREGDPESGMGLRGGAKARRSCEILQEGVGRVVGGWRAGEGMVRKVPVVGENSMRGSTSAGPGLESAGTSAWVLTSCWLRWSCVGGVAGAGGLSDFEGCFLRRPFNKVVFESYRSS